MMPRLQRLCCPRKRLQFCLVSEHVIKFSMLQKLGWTLWPSTLHPASSLHIAFISSPLSMPRGTQSGKISLGELRDPIKFSTKNYSNSDTPCMVSAAPISEPYPALKSLSPLPCVPEIRPSSKCFVQDLVSACRLGLCSAEHSQFCLQSWFFPSFIPLHTSWTSRSSLN